ncbi:MULTISPECIES: PTS sugar transporter subunit IIA [unclassified Lactobacillus]|uniref:PTS sugar transporter subunit IIA n=1 Tax=unclassified Lactobacillus TaxID=2620435 RepID=UPI002269A8C6|nr:MULTISPECIES: PTS sugar transporter subunit IIA [unclassified Lactobacillus]MCX8721536.1 PTS sugar transporter subunit IIA [Lactobacillus sp. B4010]MCX8733259.1 PTS sugar transporter subunit IIA [Lactobacillus sp. B4015]MCX8735380.1 PTS sugar transporter subunit IIA [Lactobacillus sp. B4012]
MSEKSKMSATLFKGADSSVISQKSAFKEVAINISRIMKIDSKNVIDSLERREKANNTALIQGLAIPHIILEKNFSPWLYVFKSNKCIADWHCLDDSKVTVLICLVVPKKINQQDGNFKKIMYVINKLAEEDVVSQISKTKTAKQIINILES